MVYGALGQDVYEKLYPKIKLCKYEGFVGFMSPVISIQ